MKIVSVQEIPKSTQIPPLDKLLEVYATGQQMEEICKKNNGVGLAAVQVGIPWKFFVYYNEDLKSFEYIADAKYEPLEQNSHLSIEGCLSLRHGDKMRFFKDKRFDSIKVSGKKIVAKDKVEIEEFEKILNKSLESVVFQHEIDHQNNTLISDIGEEIDIQDKIR